MIILNFILIWVFSISGVTTQRYTHKHPSYFDIVLISPYLMSLVPDIQYLISHIWWRTPHSYLILRYLSPLPHPHSSIYRYSAFPHPFINFHLSFLILLPIHILSSLFYLSSFSPHPHTFKLPHGPHLNPPPQLSTYPHHTPSSSYLHSSSPFPSLLISLILLILLLTLPPLLTSPFPSLLISLILFTPPLSL